jgi:hypothetical protein
MENENMMQQPMKNKRAVWVLTTEGNNERMHLNGVYGSVRKAAKVFTEKINRELKEIVQCCTEEYLNEVLEENKELMTPFSMTQTTVEWTCWQNSERASKTAKAPQVKQAAVLAHLKADDGLCFTIIPYNHQNHGEWDDDNSISMNKEVVE